jgi:hypothetical protein
VSDAEGGPSRAAAGTPRRRRARLIIVAALALGAVAVVFFMLRDPTPVLDPAALAAARERWRARGLQDYDITVAVETDARPAETMKTEVRAGRAVRLLRNGQPVDLRDAYTVEGLFDIMGREVEMARAKETGARGAPRGAKLRASFHETLGVPAVFKRLASGRMSLVITLERIETPAGEVLQAR